MNLKNITISKTTKAPTRRFKWEDEIKRAESEWAESIKKYSRGKK